MIVLVCGSREWTKIKPIWRELKKLKKRGKIDLVVHGDCKGADRLAGWLAKKKLKLDVKAVPYKSELGRAGGPVRNQEMIDKYHPTFALAFHEDITKSRGTKDMIKRLEKHGIPYVLVEK